MTERFGMSLAAVLLLATACGGARDDGAGPEPTADRVVTTISIPSASASIAVHQPTQIEPLFFDQNGVELLNVTGTHWASSDPSIGSVDGSGNVTGVKVGGPITITVTAGNGTATTAVRVIPTLGLAGAVSVMGVDSVAALSASITDFFGVVLQPATVTWSSSNTSIATVTASGQVRGVGSGTATITATEPTASAQFTIEVGVYTTIDGTWTGHSASRGDPSVRIVFGSIRDVSWQFVGSSVNGVGSCTLQLHSAVNVPIVNNQFAVPLQYQGSLSGDFTSTTVLNATAKDFFLTREMFSCSAIPATTVQTSQLGLPVSLVMSKQP